MIDIILSVYNNYELLYYQFFILQKIKGDFTILICDNTSPEYKQNIMIPENLVSKTKLYNYINEGIDGEKHGDVIDYMIFKTTNEIICIMDLDFFWLDINILEYVRIYFNDNYKCVGTELYYDGFEYVNLLYPKRHGALCPCIFGMFIDKKYIKHSFVSNKTDAEIYKKETGWKIRQDLIENNIKIKTFNSIKHPILQAPTFNNIKNYNLPIFYVGNQNFIGVHLVGSTTSNKNNKELIEHILKPFFPDLI